MRLLQDERKKILQGLKTLSTDTHIDDADLAEIMDVMDNGELVALSELQRQLLWDALGTMPVRHGELVAIYKDLTRMAFPKGGKVR